MIRLKSIMRGKNVRVDDLADYMGVCRQSVYNWRSNKYTPNSKNMKELSDFLKVTPEFILGR